MYGIFAIELNATRARAVIKHLLTLLPEHTLRLQLTLQQAGGSGLTCFMLILDMIRECPNFNWGALAELVPGEWANLLAALDEVAGNVWFGYNSAKGNASSSGLGTLFYAAKCLAQQVLGLQTWKQYHGGRAGVRSKDLINAMVAAYAGRDFNRPEEVPEDIWENNIPPQIMDRLQNYRMVDPELTDQERQQLRVDLRQCLEPEADAAHPDLEDVPVAYTHGI